MRLNRMIFRIIIFIGVMVGGFILSLSLIEDIDLETNLVVDDDLGSQTDHDGIKIGESEQVLSDLKDGQDQRIPDVLESLDHILDTGDSEVEEDAASLGQVKVRKDNYQVIISMEDKDFNLEIGFDYNGPNRLYGLDYFDYDLYEYPEIEHLLEVTSDFIGPYMVAGMDVDAEVKAEFTGGWHLIDGFTTGRTKEVLLQAEFEGVLMDLDFEKPIKETKFDRLIIRVTNEIDGYDNLEPAILEEIVYEIGPGKVDVSLTGKAIRDIEIERYYGLQSQNRTWWGEITYISESGERQMVSPEVDSEGFTKGNDLTDKILLHHKDYEIELEYGIIRQGLGNLTYLENAYSTAFTRAYGKSYFYLVGGKLLSLKEGQTFNWAGYYKFF